MAKKPADIEVTTKPKPKILDKRTLKLLKVGHKRAKKLGLSVTLKPDGTIEVV